MHGRLTLPIAEQAALNRKPRNSLRPEILIRGSTDALLNCFIAMPCSDAALQRSQDYTDDQIKNRGTKNQEFFVFRFWFFHPCRRRVQGRTARNSSRSALLE
jgi:hypothetical protein